MGIIGHDEARARLRHLAPVTLIQGPSGVGKRLLAREAAFGVVPVGRVMEYDRVLMPEAQAMLNLCRVRGSWAFIFDAGMTPVPVTNTLLKILEEPPPNIYFILYSSMPVLPTLRSRAELVRVGTLTEDQVADILICWGSPEDRARLAAKLADGRPGRAEQIEQMFLQKPIVVQLLKAAAYEDRALLTNTLPALMPRDDAEWAEMRATGELSRARLAMDGLRQALVEIRTGHRVMFSPNDTYGLEKLPSSELDVCISICGRKARSVMLARVVVGRLLSAVEKDRKGSGGMPIP